MNIAIEGQKYEGKTTLAFWLACRIRDRASTYKICIFDPKWAFRSEWIFAHGKTRRVRWAESAEDFEELLSMSGTAVVYRPRLSMQDDETRSMWDDFTSFCDVIGLEDLLRNPPGRPVVLLIDEAYVLQRGQSIHPALSSAIRLATKGSLYIILAVHGPRELSPMVRRQLDEMYLFRQNDPTDLDFIRERCGSECALAVSKLEQHHLVVYRSRMRSWEKWENPNLWEIKEYEQPSTASSASAA